MPQTILACIDAPDPDNFVMLIALARQYPEANLYVMLTGRPVRLNATRQHQLWEWDMQSSMMAQQASALRIKNFLRHFGVKVFQVFDGGIAPRTLVPHWIHFAEYYKFLDADPLQALRYSELEPQEDLIKILLRPEVENFAVVVGGPMTGLHQMLVRNPGLTPKISEVHAMFATWGEVQLMQMEDKPRGALQFNVACDPQSAYGVLKGLSCPIYLMPSEVTRVAEIGFANAQKLRELLPDNAGTRALYHLYALWYDAAVKPRQDKNPSELIFIHDLVSAFSCNAELRDRIYEVTPITIGRVPCLPNEAADWGKVEMAPTNQPTNHFAARRLKPGGAEIYLQTLKQMLS